MISARSASICASCVRSTGISSTFEAAVCRGVHQRSGLRLAPVIGRRRRDNAEHRHMGTLSDRMRLHLRQPQEQHRAERTHRRRFPSFHGSLSPVSLTIN